jgi:GDP-L-fucose synthase
LKPAFLASNYVLTVLSLSLSCSLLSCVTENNTDFTIWGSGTPLRQFLYAKDLGKLFLWTLKEYDESEPIILSVPPEAEVSIKDVALAIAKAMKFKGNVVV